jgi:ribose transport system permease protein
VVNKYLMHPGVARMHPYTSQKKVGYTMNAYNKAILNHAQRESGFIKKYNMLFVLIGMLVICAVASPVFLSPKNLLNLLQQNSVYGIMAVGMSFLIISGAIDLSAGAVLALTGVAAAAVIMATGSYIIGVLAGLSMGVLVGLLNGVLVTKLKINYFISTLGTMTIINGVVLITTGGTPITGISPDFAIMGMGKLGAFPIAIIIWIAFVAFMQFLLKYTKYGQYVYAMGGNARAAWLSGINVDKYKILTYILTGLFASGGGILYLSRTLLAAPDAGTGYELKVIAACIVGGISLDGGKGDVFNSVIGVVILGLILNILQLSGVSSYYQDIITGLVIIAAVAASNISKLKRD